MLPLLVITIPVSHGRGRSHWRAATTNASGKCTNLEPPKHHKPDPNDDRWLESHPSDDNPYKQSPKQSQAKYYSSTTANPPDSRENPNLYKTRLGKLANETRRKKSLKNSNKTLTPHTPHLINPVHHHQQPETPMCGRTRSDPHATGWNPTAKLNDAGRTRKSRGENTQKGEEGGIGGEIGGGGNRGRNRGRRKKREAAPSPQMGNLSWES